MAVVRLSPFSLLLARFSFVLLVLVLLPGAPTSAQSQDLDAEPRYLVDVELNTAEELLGALTRVEQLLQGGSFNLDSSNPVAFVLHGPEVRTLLKQNYPRHRSMVDLAAKLSALGVVDIRACETWMGGNRINPDDLHPFIGTVPNGPDEERRLLEDDYIYF